MKKRKNNKKILILSLLLILFLTITATQAAEIQDNTTTTSDSNAITSEDVKIDTQQSVSENNILKDSNNDSLTDLEQTINSGGNVVELTHDYNYRYGDSLDGINITKDNLVIDGKGHIIDGKGESKIFTITGNNITLKNIIIKNAFSNQTYTIHNNDYLIVYEGAAISWLGENGTLSNSNINNNNINIVQKYSPDYSGAIIDINFAAGIVWAGANGKIYKTTFDSNNATREEATKVTGALLLIGENATVTNSIFTNNDGWSSGALRSDSVNTILSDLSFTNNYGRSGAAMYLGNCNNITNCEFKSNLARNNAGSILVAGINNTISNSNFINNSAVNEGGAIYVNNANNNIFNCNFINSTATSQAGAVKISGINSTISYCNFINNSAVNNGALLINQPNCNVYNCNFTNNYASKSIASLNFGSSNGKVFNCIFSNNTAIEGTGAMALSSNNVTIFNCNFTNNTGRNAGALGVANSGLNSTIVNCNFIKNKITFAWGGALNIYAGSVYNCTFIANENKGTSPNGGAVMIAGPDVIFSGNKFIDNVCNGGGGAIFAQYNSRISDCTFTNNRAGNGGAIRSNGNCTIDNCTFINNRANNGGGAIYTEKNATITNCIFINSSTNIGGAIYTSNGNITIMQSIFKNNTATSRGGAIAQNTNVNAIIKYNAFISSTSTKNNGISEVNGVECNWFGSNKPTYKVGSILIAKLEKISDEDYIVGNEWNGIVKVVFYDNSTDKAINEAVVARSIIYNLTNKNIRFKWDYTTESGKIFGNNAAREAFNITATVDSQKLETLVFNGLNPSTSNTFKDLQKLIDGMAPGETLELTKDYIYNPVNDNSNIINITKPITITGNFAISGANQAQIFNITSDNVELINLTITNAKSTDNGGAIVWNGNNGKVTNVKFINNNALGFGGAIYATGNNININSAFFNNNIAQDGSALYIIGNNTVLTNSIFDKNPTTSLNGFDIYIKGNKTKINKVTVNNTNNAIKLIGDNATINDIILENIKGDGIVINGIGAIIDGVIINNLNGTGIITLKENATIKNIDVTGGKGTVVDVVSGTKISNLNSTNHDGIVIKGQGDDISAIDIYVTNNTDDDIIIKGNNANLKNIIDINGTGTIATIKGNDAVIDGIYATNHTGNTLDVIGQGASISNIPAGDPEKLFVIPTNITTNSPTFGLTELLSDATGYFNVEIDGKLYKSIMVDNRLPVNTITVYNLTSGNHTVNLIYTGDGKYQLTSKSVNITIPKPIPVITLSGNNINVLYSGIATYKVQVLADGKPVPDNESVVIKFNGASTTVKTVGGYASLGLNTLMAINTYSINATYKNKTVSNTVSINNIIDAKKLKKFKKSKKVTKVKVTLAKVNGIFIKGKTLILKIKGKKIATAKTNKKGIATFKVKKNKLKKFKPKKYTAIVTYGADIVTKKIKISK